MPVRYYDRDMNNMDSFNHLKGFPMSGFEVTRGFTNNK